MDGQFEPQKIYPETGGAVSTNADPASSAVAVDAVFAALGDPTRRRILERLAHQSMSATQLTRDASISRQAIVKHLQILHTAGLVTRARKGKAVHYRAATHQIAATGRWMQRTAAAWERSLD